MKKVYSTERTIIPPTYPKDYSTWISELNNHKINIGALSFEKIDQLHKKVLYQINAGKMNSLLGIKESRVTRVIPVLNEIAAVFNMKLSNKKHFTFCYSFLKQIITND